MRFLATSQYDSSRCERYWGDAGHLWLLNEFYGFKALWAWAVKEEDVEDFLNIYLDVEWSEIQIGERFFYTVDFRRFDQWVMGIIPWEELPPLEEFDPGSHTIEKIVEWGYEDFSPHPEERPTVRTVRFANPWAVLVSPAPLTRDWEIENFYKKESG